MPSQRPCKEQLNYRELALVDTLKTLSEDSQSFSSLADQSWANLNQLEQSLIGILAVKINPDDLLAREKTTGALAIVMGFDVDYQQLGPIINQLFEEKTA